MPPPTIDSISEFAVRVATRPGQGDWLALVVTRGKIQALAKLLAEELKTLAKRDTVVIADVANARDLARAIRINRTNLTIVFGVEQFSERDWTTFDTMRSAVEGAATVVFVLSEQATRLMLDHSPNIASWFGGGVWQLGAMPSEFEDDAQVRMATFREMTGMTDEEIIARAEAKTLGAEPIFAEWLTLLGRANLLGGE